MNDVDSCPIVPVDIRSEYRYNVFEECDEHDASDNVG